MNLPATTIQIQRWVITLTLAAAIIVFSTETVDPFQIPKLTLAAIGATAIVLMALVRTVVRGQVEIPRSPLLGATAVFLVGLVVTTVASGEVAHAIQGTYPRLTGAGLYLICAVLLAASLRVFTEASVPTAIWIVLGTSAVMAVYVLLQWLGADPLNWTAEIIEHAVFGTLGNPNFAAGLLGSTAALAAWAAITSKHPNPARVVSLVVLVLMLLAVSATRSLQGLVAAGASLSVVALAWIRTRPVEIRRWATLVWSAAAAIGFLAVSVGVFARGPLAMLGDRRSVELRHHYWDAASAMFRESPFLGVGPGLYGSHFEGYRTIESVRDMPPGLTADSAHSVPLQLFAEGGLVIGLPYLAIVATTGVALIIGLRRLRGERLLLLGAVGGTWLGYQAQSLVSIDVPALAVVHWVFAALVVVLATPPSFSTWRLPWGRDGDGGRNRDAPVRMTEGSQKAVAAAALVLLVLTMFPLTRLWRADLAAADGVRTQPADPAALERLDRAVDLAPWQPTYSFERARLLAAVGRIDEAQESLDRALEINPRYLEALLNAARMMAAVQDSASAYDYYSRLHSAAPNDPRFLAEGIEFYLTHDRHDAAEDASRRLLEVLPEDADAWVLHGHALVALGHVGRAEQAYERALHFDANHAEARAALSDLER